MASETKHSQVKSRQRVVDHGEVFTAEREVNAMLDLVKQETERIDSRFLEPACGTGNFLIEILRRKLAVVEGRYARSQLEFERYAVLAVSSVYGIDILLDNVIACRERLFELFDEVYTGRYRAKAGDECRAAARYILGRNIVHGDALTLQTVDDPPRPILFSEWSLVRGSQVKRRDFTFAELLERAGMTEPNLFTVRDRTAFIPVPAKEYPLTHFLRLPEAG